MFMEGRPSSPSFEPQNPTVSSFGRGCPSEATWATVCVSESTLGRSLLRRGKRGWAHTQWPKRTGRVTECALGCALQGRAPPPCVGVGKGRDALIHRRQITQNMWERRQKIVNQPKISPAISHLPYLSSPFHHIPLSPIQIIHASS